MKRYLKVALPLVLAAMVTSLAADTQANWDKHCAKCHGKEGKGDTTMGKKLKVKDYSSAEVQEKMKDEEILKTIKEGKKVSGKTVMKGFDSLLSAEEITELVKHIRKMKK